jgi:CobQ/CobB/MinD/ParA nucleotide binding domain
VTRSQQFIVYRDELLAGSETFILGQSESLPHFQPFYVGLRRRPGLTLPETRVHIVVPRWKSSTGSKKDVKANGLLAPGAGILVAHPHSQAAESYRSLRTSIMQSMRTGQCNVILVTSALPDEGKTTTSINCAAALAQQGASVLLIDADMRRSKVCNELNIASTTGLTSLIAGGSSRPA